MQRRDLTHCGLFLEWSLHSCSQVGLTAYHNQTSKQTLPLSAHSFSSTLHCLFLFFKLTAQRSQPQSLLDEVTAVSSEAPLAKYLSHTLMIVRRVQKKIKLKLFEKIGGKFEILDRIAPLC